ALRPLFEATVLDPKARIAGLVDQGVARGLFHTHLRGTGRHGGTLWSLLVLARWAERYLGPVAVSRGPVYSLSRAEDTPARLSTRVDTGGPVPRSGSLIS